MKIHDRNSALVLQSIRIQFLIGLFLTFVGIAHLSYALPSNHQNLEVDQPEENEEFPPSEPNITETLSISEPVFEKKREAKISRENYFYSFRQSMSPRVGIIYNVTSGTSLTYLLGIQYLINPSGNIFWEMGFDLLTKGNGIFHVTRRWIFNPNGIIRPYWAAGGGGLLNPEESLKTFLIWGNYHIRVTGGFEYWFIGPSSFRLDVEAIYQFDQSISLGLIFGYSWGW